MIKNIPKTERTYKKSKPIDHLSSIEAIALMIKEQKDASIGVYKAMKSIEIATDKIYEHLKSSPKGRLIYAGAGTSGRIGVQDGVELLPTFSWPQKRLDYIIAGGKKAILKSIENAEDDTQQAIDKILKKSVNSQDVVIALAASGNTPFTCKILEEAKKTGALTIGISNNPNGNLLKFADGKIILDTKEELIAGSTRLKAGTAQKICLNIISSMVMIKMGRVKNGKMSHMLPTNQKLRDRKIRIDKSA
ncbi:N-acetylmuramic acid 6-phosphate etherase [Alphaproteobacteria bacterium]|nr:N-acetylmuramic acid 6-phosphate etherase [Alphaproteobacteria bacterium]MDC1085895.1 N-acetylmuramic acid 6-phosphate etherase [Alphaproteobacteria bacterium]